MNAGVQLVVLFVFVFVSSLGFQAVEGATHSQVRSSILKQTFMETLSELFHFFFPNGVLIRLHQLDCSQSLGWKEHQLSNRLHQIGLFFIVE